MVRRPWAVTALGALLADVAMEVALCTRGTSGLRDRFRALLDGLLIPREAYSPASLRPGGAIAFHLAHDDLGKLLYHGRWDSTKTVQHYLHEGVSATAASALPRRTAQLIVPMSALLEELIADAAAVHAEPRAYVGATRVA